MSATTARSMLAVGSLIASAPALAQFEYFSGGAQITFSPGSSPSFISTPNFYSEHPDAIMYTYSHYRVAPVEYAFTVINGVNQGDYAADWGTYEDAEKDIYQSPAWIGEELDDVCQGFWWLTGAHGQADLELYNHILNEWIWIANVSDFAQASCSS